MKILKIKEHDLKIEGDPLRIKIVAEALGEYVSKHQIDDTTLCDFNFSMETAYQAEFCLDQDDWDFTQRHKEVLNMVPPGEQTAEEDEKLAQEPVQKGSWPDFINSIK